jgi:hypothetical protein
VVPGGRLSLPKTRNELNEAKQQLQEMETFARARAPHPRSDNDYEVLERYLSACIGAARSVAWILKSENKAIHSRVMSKWADNLENEARRLLETTNRLRVTEVHGKYEH